MSHAYRRATADDMRFCQEAWLDNFRTSHTAGLVCMDDWRDVMVPQIQKVLSRSGVEVWVVCNPGGDKGTTDLHGFLAIERDYKVPTRTRVRGKQTEVLEETPVPLVHYIFIKHSYRGFGFARGLFKAAGISPDGAFNYTCRTAVVSKLKSKIPLATWSPLIARHPKD